MNVSKSLVSVILVIPYICLLGAFSFCVEFSDKTEIRYNGWLI